MEKFIDIKGAKMHNLKNLDLKIPHKKISVITGLSGSGKSTIAFDTIFAEGQRRYIESLSSYARQFLGKLDKPNSMKFASVSASPMFRPCSTDFKGGKMDTSLSPNNSILVSSQFPSPTKSSLV